MQFTKTLGAGKTYPTSSYMTSESCLGFIFSAPARLSASDCLTIEVIYCRSSSCHESADSDLYLVFFKLENTQTQKPNGPLHKATKTQ